MQSDSSNSSIINRLFESFTELETAIESAKETLAKREAIPAEIMQRLNSYDGILEKQRGYAQSLCNHINQGNWDEVARHVSLINGLSSMIRDDARAILSHLALNSDKAEDKDNMNFC